MFMVFTLLIIIVTIGYVQSLGLPSDEEIEILISRRIEGFVSHYDTSIKNAEKWANSLNETTGKWPSIDYKSGCEARIANWPALGHLTKTMTLAVGHKKDPKNPLILTKARQALNFWLDRDFTEPDCVDKGGKKKGKCVCGTPGLWNKNWFAQVIGVPRLMGGVCLILSESLGQRELGGCRTIMGRAYERVTRPNTGLTGANLLDVSSVGISLGLLNRNKTLLTEALGIFYSGVYENHVPFGDGIQSDGSFMQHAGILYNGNYGKDYIKNLVSVFVMTKNTSLIPPVQAQELFDRLLEGSEWMMMADTQTGRLLWQYSAIGRMISFRYSDHQASSRIDLDLDAILEGTQGWEAENSIRQRVERLQQPVQGVNQGGLVGTRYFYDADYMVHRMPGSIVTLKMFSNRSSNAECLNGQNPLGAHLSDGTIYNYLTGDDYRDVFAAWSWDLLPGTTTEPNQTLPTCKELKIKGQPSFVGGVTEANSGLAVLDFRSRTGSMGFQKTVFFFPLAYAVQVESSQDSSLTVLDQRRAQGQTMYVDGQSQEGPVAGSMQTLWYDRLGYSFPEPRSVHVELGEKMSNWSQIGISKGQDTVRLWSAYVQDDAPLTQYVVQPGIEAETFLAQNGSLPVALHHQPENPKVHAAYSAQDRAVGIAFWTPGLYSPPWKPWTIKTDQPGLVLLTQTDQSLLITVSDPSQTLTQIHLDLLIQNRSYPLAFDLPRPGQPAAQTVIL